MVTASPDLSTRWVFAVIEECNFIPDFSASLQSIFVMDGTSLRLKDLEANSQVSGIFIQSRYWISSNESFV